MSCNIVIRNKSNIHRAGSKMFDIVSFSYPHKSRRKKKIAAINSPSFYTLTMMILASIVQKMVAVYPHSVTCTTSIESS